MKRFRAWIRSCPLWHRPQLETQVVITWKLASFNLDQKTTLPKEGDDGLWYGYFHRNVTIDGEVDYNNDPNSATLTLTLPPKTASLAVKKMQRD